MLLKTRLYLWLDRLLDLLPGHRSDATSLEAKVRKAVQRNTDILVKEAQHLDAIMDNAERKAEAVLQAAIRSAAAFHEELLRLDDSRLLRQTDELMQVLVGTGLAGGSKEVTLERVPPAETSV